MIEFTADTFAEWRNEVLYRPGVVIAYFTAPWCGPCKMLKPRLEELEKENEGLTVVRVDVESNPVLARDFRIMSVPQLLFYQQGHQEEVLTGIKPKHFLQAVLDNLPQRN